MAIAREASGISSPPSLRTGAWGAIRRASQVLSRAGARRDAQPLEQHRAAGPDAGGVLNRRGERRSGGRIGAVFGRRRARRRFIGIR
jgi:hypothetical protein